MVPEWGSKEAKCLFDLMVTFKKRSSLVTRNKNRLLQPFELMISKESLEQATTDLRLQIKVPSQHLAPLAHLMFLHP